MGRRTLFAATPAPLDHRGRVLYPLSGTGLETVHDRVDALPKRLVSACGYISYLKEPEDADETRAVLHDAVDDVLATAPYWCPILDRQRPWVVSGGVTAGDLPWDFENVMALGISGVTEMAVDSEEPAPSRLLAHKIVPSVRDRLGEKLAGVLQTSGMGTDEQAAVLAATLRSMAADEEAGIDAIAMALRTRWSTWPGADLFWEAVIAE